MQRSREGQQIEKSSDLKQLLNRVGLIENNNGRYHPHQRQQANFAITDHIGFWVADFVNQRQQGKEPNHAAHHHHDHGDGLKFPTQGRQYPERNKSNTDNQVAEGWAVTDHQFQQ